MGKRKEDQRRDDSSSSSSESDGKRRRPRHYKNGETSRPKDGTLTLIEIKDFIQDKESTEAKFNRKIAKLKDKRKKDKEDLRILKGHVGILMENIRILKEGHEYLKSKIQEMQKGGCAEVDHDKSSQSQRLQLSQSTRFRLIIETRLCTPIYKNEMVETEDGGGHIKVIMYDGGSPIAPDHPLASVKVDLVVIEGRFNDKRDSWSKEEFEKSIITPREGMIRLVKNGTFDLIGGSCEHPGAIIMDNSQKKEVKLGVMIAVRREERVLEGVSNPFKVQEGKTKRSQNKGKQPSLPVPTPILGQSTSAYSTLQHGPASPVRQHSLPPPLQKAVNGNHTKFPANDTGEDYLLGYPPPTVPLMVEGNGQALNGNGQNSSQQFQAQMWGQSTSPYPIHHGQVYSWTPPSIQNQLQVAVSCPVNQPLLARGQDQYTSFPNGSSEHAYQNPSAYASLNDAQATFIPKDVHYSDAHTQMQVRRSCSVSFRNPDPKFVSWRSWWGETSPRSRWRSRKEVPRNRLRRRRWAERRRTTRASVVRHANSGTTRPGGMEAEEEQLEEGNETEDEDMTIADLCQEANAKISVAKGKRTKMVPAVGTKKSLRNKGDKAAMTSMTKAKLLTAKKNLEKGLEAAK